jgi:hypothetical protein
MSQVNVEQFSMPLRSRAVIERLRVKYELVEALSQVGLLCVLTGIACLLFIRLNWSQGALALGEAMVVGGLVGYALWCRVGEPLFEWTGLDVVQYEWLPPAETRELAKLCDEASGARPYLELVRAAGRPLTCGEACAIYDWLEVRAGLSGLEEGLRERNNPKN